MIQIKMQLSTKIDTEFALSFLLIHHLTIYMIQHYYDSKHVRTPFECSLPIMIL